jgi:Tol biopolymer transport system component
MTHRDDEQLAVWLTDGPHHGPVGALEDALTQVRSTGQRPIWMVNLTGGTIAQQPRGGIMRTAILAVTVVALLGLLIGGMIAAGVIGPKPRLPALVDDTGSPSPTDVVPSPTAPQPLAGLVAYNVVTQLDPGQGDCTEANPSRSTCFESHTWLSNADGSGAHRLFPEEFTGQRVLAWSSDGAHILYQGATGDGDGGDLKVTDPAGSERHPLIPSALCAYPCTGADGIAWSPDGTRIAFVRGEGSGVGVGPAEEGTVIAIVDIASGQVTELETTRTTNVSPETCSVSTQCEGMNDTPRWSPDGSRLVFARQVMSPEPGSAWTSAAVYVVNPDGSDLRRVTPTGFYAFNASWSPDGSQLVFVNTEMVVNADHTSVTDMLDDIYTVLPDGADVRRLTDDGRSFNPTWTAGGRLAFTRAIPGADAACRAAHAVWPCSVYDNWIMDADGGNLSKLGTSLAELTSAGCIRCMYPLPKNEYEYLTEALWQPTR